MTTLIQHLELNTGANPKGTIIWMHGLGADCWDFVSIVKELGLPADLPLRFIFPQAPTRPITINNGQAMPGWYDISMAELQRKPDEAGVRQSQAAIEQLIARESERGMATDILARHVPDAFGAEAFLCGPPPMIDAAIGLLERLGVDASDIHFDKFTPAK